MFPCPQRLNVNTGEKYNHSRPLNYQNIKKNYHIYMYKPHECQRQKGCCWNIYVTTLYYTLRPRVHIYITSENGGWELFRMALRAHVQTPMPRTWERCQASYRWVRRGKCKSIKMRVLGTERTSSPHVNLTIFLPISGESVDLRPTTISKEFVALCGLRRIVRLNQRVGGA